MSGFIHLCIFQVQNFRYGDAEVVAAFKVNMFPHVFSWRRDLHGLFYICDSMVDVLEFVFDDINIFVDGFNYIEVGVKSTGDFI